MINNLNQGITLHKSGRFEEAKKIYEEVLKKNPDNFEIINLLGIISLQLQNYDEAIILINKAININPNHHALYNNLGATYKNLKKYNEAIINFKKAIELNPNYAEAYNNLGSIFKNINQYEEAFKNYIKSIELKPSYPEAHNNLGLLYKELKKYDEAIKSFDKTIELNGSYHEAYVNRADTFFLHGKYLLAIKDYNKLAELRPENKSSYQISIFIIKNIICDWQDYEKNILDLEKKLINKEIYIDSMNVLRCFDSLNIIKNSTCTEELRLTIKNLGEFYKKKVSYKSKKKIKIGYYSADFRNHPVAHLIADLLESHNKVDFEIIGFYFDKYPDDKVTKRISLTFDKFYYTKNISDDDIISKSRELGIDIAIDLMGYTRNNRSSIFIKQVAPIQVNFLGYPGTTSYNNDYIIADKYLISSINQKFYFEKIIYMPNCYQPSDSKRSVFNNDHYNKEFYHHKSNVKLCCLNDSSKINPLIFNAWIQILKETENSLLFLLESNKYCKENLIKEVIKKGVSSSRLIFLSKLPYEEHLLRFKSFDLFLDTFPYSAHTTANESLWSGVPLISLVGESFQSRVSSSLLQNLGMNELITTNVEDYKNLIISLVNNPAKLKDIKIKLINNSETSNVFDTKLYAINLEKAYKKIYERHKNNLEPENIYIN
jgi:predicted O-linked N-acetylglucosamine transferase (SPINDLY family)